MTESDSRLRGEKTSAPEKGFALIVKPFEQFVRDQKTAGTLLLVCTLVALTIPARSPPAFVRRSRQLRDEFEDIDTGNAVASPILAEPEQHSVIEQLQETAAEVTIPLQLWERALEHPIALFVLPLFALVNAGIAVDPAAHCPHYSVIHWHWGLC